MKVMIDRIEIGVAGGARLPLRRIPRILIGTVDMIAEIQPSMNSKSKILGIGAGFGADRSKKTVPTTISKSAEK